MTQSINASRLFNASCFALITTAFSFSIRAGILAQLGEEYGFSAEQLGTINSMWFLGFPISMVIGGADLQFSGWKENHAVCLYRACGRYSADHLFRWKLHDPADFYPVDRFG